MKAAVLRGPGRIEVCDMPIPHVGPGEVLVQVQACGICGSDVHAYRTGLLSDVSVATSDGGRVLGHEFSGVVVEVAPDVRRLGVGDRVVGVALGGFAEFVKVLVDDRNIHPLADSLTFQEGATTEPLAVAYHAVAQVEAEAGDHVVIIGAGAIGLSCLQAVAGVAASVTVVDISRAKLHAAQSLGATHTVDARSPSATEDVLTLLTRGGAADGADAVLECAGARTTAEQAIRLVRPGHGRVGLLAFYERAPEWDLNEVIRRGITLRGCVASTRRDFLNAIDAMTQGQAPRTPLISREFDLSDVHAAFELCSQDPDIIKVLLRP